MSDNPQDRSDGRFEDPALRHEGTTTSADPQPDQTAGLDAGGGVIPGDTPPGEASTSFSSHVDPPLPSSGVNWVVYAVIGLVVVLAAAFFFGRFFG